MKTVGRRYAELDELEAKITAALAKSQPDNDDLKKRAERARKTADTSASQKNFENNEESASQFTPSEEFKALYRQAARLMHPDLATDDADRQRRAKAMALVNEAFANGDEAVLRRLISEWSSSPDHVEGEGIAADLVRAIRKIHQIRRRLGEVQDEMKGFLNNPLFELKTQVESAKASGRDLFKEMAKELDALIADANKRWEQIQKSE